MWTIIQLILFGGNSSASGGGTTPTGDGRMRFNLNPGIDTGLLALLEDI